MIRAFVAIPLPDEAVRALTLAQAGLPVGRPVPPENFHLTLAFLGEHQEPVIEDMHLALETIRWPDFEIALSGAGLFGSKRPRAAYAGIKADPALGGLREKVLRAARETGIRIERERYVPHVTLARLPRDMSPDETADLRDFVGRRAGLSTAPFPAESFALYRSTLGRNGAIYEALADYPLR